MKLRHLTKITAVATSSLIAGSATGPIGAVQAIGRFTLNGVPTMNQATLLDGAVVENSRATTEIRVNGGSYLILGQEAKAEFHQDGATLLRGTVQIADAKNYSLNAKGFKVVSDSKGDTLLVAMDHSMVHVGALKGEGRVYDAKGALIARVTPGMTLELKPGMATPQTMQVSGNLIQQDGRFYVDDQVSHVRIEVIGKNFSNYLGETVHLSGSVVETAPAPNVAYKVKVDSINKAGAGAIAGSAAGGAAIGAAGAGTGAAIGTTTAVIGGVAVAGAAGGTIAAVKLKSEPAKNLSH